MKIKMVEGQQKVKAVIMTEREYHQHENDNDGVCLSCGKLREGMTEPDAENYPCEHCSENNVQGMMNLLMDGNITLIG